MTTPAIVGLGGYVPRYVCSSEAVAEAWDRHLASGIDGVAVPDGDEDALTMAYEATTRALAAADVSPEAVAFLALATTTPPLEVEDLGVRLASTVGVGDRATVEYAVASPRVGMATLRGAIRRGPWTDGVGVVVAADAPRGSPDGERGHAAGAGAAAVVLDEAGPGVVDATAHAVEAAPGEHYRPPTADADEGLGITPYERRVYTDVITTAVDRLDADVADVDAAAIQGPDGKRPYRVAGALDLEAEQVAAGTVIDRVGDTGAAQPLLGLVNAVEAGHHRVLAVGYGAGAAAEAMLLEVGDVPVAARLEPSESLSYARALRRRGALSGGEPAGGGAHVSMPTWQRSLPQRHRLVAGRCLACEALAMPPEGACARCGSREGFEPVRLPGTGTVETVTSISSGGAPPEFDEQQARSGPITTAIVALDGPEGNRVRLPLQVVETGDEPIEVGDPVTATIRRIYTQEGVPRYGVKVRPLDGDTGGND